MFCDILFMFVFLFRTFAFYFVYSVFCIVSPSVYSCFFPIFVHVYQTQTLEALYD